MTDEWSRWQDGADGYTTLDLASTSNYLEITVTSEELELILDRLESKCNSRYYETTSNNLVWTDRMESMAKMVQTVTTLVASTSEPIGNYCNVGGTRIDSNRLESKCNSDISEITTTTYVCDETGNGQDADC